jgi:prolyl oligopeptidase
LARNDALPGREGLRARLQEILGAQMVLYRLPAATGKTLLALKVQPPRQQPMLVAMPGPDGTDGERVLLDPSALDASGHTTIDWFRASPDGKLVAVSLSKGGSEAGDVHVYTIADGKEAFEVIPRVQGGTAGGDLLWQRDSKSFFYTRYPRGTEQPPSDSAFFVQIYRHALGTPTEKDTYELGQEFPRIAEFRLASNPAGIVLAAVQNGDNGEFMHFLRAADGKWKQLTRFEDRIVQIVFGEKNDFYLTRVSRSSCGSCCALRSRDSTWRARTRWCRKAKIRWCSISTAMPRCWRTAAIFTSPTNSEVPRRSGCSISTANLSMPPNSCPFRAYPGSRLSTKESSSLPTSRSSSRRGFHNPARPTRKTKMSMRVPVDLAGVKVVREMATSKDGTQVPVNLLFPKGFREGSAVPFQLTGYGGFAISEGPRFRAMTSLLLDRGVGVAIANLRGGSEFGEEWHQQGRLTRKQNVFDDFVAAFEHLRARKYAVPDRIGIVGGSNGGLLMGAMLTQHPELPQAVVSFVGIYDMLRVETEPNGAFNATEYGTVKDVEQFKALYAYSPYHHVKDGTAYPAVLLLTGENDARVAPWHSHKMAARLQQATSSSAPILERVQASAGHGPGSSLDIMIEQNADAYAFMLHHLGVEGY